MSDSNNIDQLLRQRLSDTAVPPPTFVWPNIERELRRRRRRVILWWMLPLMAGTSLWAIWMYQRDGHSGNLTHSDSQSPNHIVEPAHIEHQHSALATDGLKADGPSINTQSRPNTTVSETNTPELVRSAPAWRVKQHVATPAQTDILTPKGGKSQVDSYVSSDKTDVEKPIETTPEPAINSQASETRLQDTWLPLTPLNPREYLTLEYPVSTLKPHTIALKSEAPPKRKRVAHNCYDFHRNPNVWLTDAYLGPSFSRVELESLPDDRPYLNQRLSTESSSFSLHAGMRASRLIQRHFLLRTGLDYQYWQEKFEYADPDYVKYLIVVTVVGGVQHIDTVGIEYGDRFVKTYNRYGVLDIPLILGTEFRQGRSGFSLNAGVSFNVLFHKRGAILAPDGEVAFFTPGEKQQYEVFTTKVGMSALGSVQWFYHLKPKTRIFAEPYIRQLMRPVNVASHPIRQRYTMTGIRLGITRILD